ncbi:MAG: polymer-forming cytoskeletal protein [Halanaerobiales bacterium]
MFNKEEEIKKDEINTVFGQETEFDGKLTTKGSIRIEGTITGTVEADGDVFVGESGKVNSNIEARKIVIAGNVEGNIVAKEKLEILQTGVLKGDIKAKKLVIEEGAKFIGKSTPLKEDDKKSTDLTKKPKENVEKKEKKD